MVAKHAVKTAFLRKVYSASAATEAARNTYLDGLETTALAARHSGKVLSSASFGSSNSSYQVFAGWQPDEVLELCEWARDYIALSTAALSVAEVPSRVRMFGTRTTNLHVMG